jgi:phosphate transport system permease protein
MKAALALGRAAAGRRVLRIVLPTALPGLVTGSLLAVARGAGETAPLLFTAFAVNATTWNLGEQMNSLPIQIFNDVGRRRPTSSSARGARPDARRDDPDPHPVARLVQRRSRLA